MVRDPMRAFLFLVVMAACGDNARGPDALVIPDASVPATANAAREVIDTSLDVDLMSRVSTATITLGPSDSPGATLEIGDLAILSVTRDGHDVPFAATSPTTDTSVLTLGLEPTTGNVTVVIKYRWTFHEQFEGISKTGYTLDWPYFCGNVFPCHSDPADGTTFSLALSNVPDGKLAVYPTTIPAQAPAYQLAWDVDALTELPLGTTTAGTNISVWYRVNGLAKAQAGSAHLVAAFDWLETTLGAYRFGPKFGVVSVGWPAGAFGGMEHHPFVHVATAAMSDEVTQIHESSHGWFGDGIRIGCWEDFLLSEGTVTYLAGRALDVVAPDAGSAAWASYATQLAAVSPTDPVWPDSCGVVDVEKDNLFTQAPYMRGAFFYRALALKLGADVVDHVLATFYAAHAGGAARMQDMLDTVKTVTGYDATTCAQSWLRSTTIPTIGPCP